MTSCGSDLFENAQIGLPVRRPRVEPRLAGHEPEVTHAAPSPPVLLIALIARREPALFGCGGGDDSGTSADDASEQFAAPTVGAGRREGGRLADVLAASDVDYIDPGATYYQFGYMVTERDAVARSSATRPPTSTPGRCSPPPSRRSPTTARRSPTSSATTSSSRRRSTAPPPRPTSSTRSSGPLLPGVANGYSRRTSRGSPASRTRSSRRRTIRPAARPRSAGSRRPTTRRW